MCKTVARVAPAVSIGTSRSTGWHSERSHSAQSPLVSVTYKDNVFGSRVAYISDVAQENSLF